MWNMQACTDGQCVHKFTLAPRAYPSWWWTLQEFLWFLWSGCKWRTPPTLQTSKKKASKQSLGFNPSQHVQNVGLLVQCEECDMWRLLFCRFKLNYQEVSELWRCLNDILYTCGVSFSELDLPGRLKDVYVRDHKCNDHIEKLYYSCELESMCCYCSSKYMKTWRVSHSVKNAKEWTRVPSRGMPPRRITHIKKFLHKWDIAIDTQLPGASICARRK